MAGRVVVVTGTDTGIGKTHLATSLLLAATARGHVAVGYKPVESGVDGTGLTDAERLESASSPHPLFHVKPPRLALRAPVSPHLAAEQEGRVLPWNEVVAWTSDARRHQSLVIELPGGLFTPLASTLLNVDALQQLQPDLTLLVAPDRLGVLHHVLAAIAGARTRGVSLDVVALVAPDASDPSTGTNADELRRFTQLPIVGPYPRTSCETLAAHPLMSDLIRRWLPG
jgi:dethiobiotin synthetase